MYTCFFSILFFLFVYHFFSLPGDEPARADLHLGASKDCQRQARKKQLQMHVYMCMYSVYVHTYTVYVHVVVHVHTSPRRLPRLSTAGTQQTNYKCMCICACSCIPNSLSNISREKKENTLYIGQAP